LSRRRRLVADDTINQPPSHLAEDGKAGDPETGRDPGATYIQRAGEVPEATLSEEPPAPGAARNPGVAAAAEGAQTAVPGSPVVAAPKRRRWLGRTRVIGIAVVTVLALAAGSGSYLLQDRDQQDRGAAAPTPSASRDTSYVDVLKETTGKLNALADRRGHAVIRRDRSGFLAGLDPSNKKLINQQKTIFKNLTTLQVTKHEFEVGYTDVPRPDNLENLGGTWDTGSADVTELVQLRKVDKQATEASYTWELTVRGGRLLITDIKPTEGSGSYAPTPWDGSVLTVVRGHHMIVAATPDAADRARQIADAAEAAYSHSLPYWRKGVPSEFVIFATAKGSTFRRWYGDDDELGEDEAIAKAIEVPSCCSSRRRVLGDVTSLRITVDTSEHPDRIDLEWTLAHELTHAVAEPLTPLSNDVMVWADEGYAEFVGVRMLESRGYVANWASVARTAARKKTFKRRLPGDDGFYGKNADANYALSVRFFEFLADRYGTGKTRDFYFYLNAMRHPDADAAMRKYFGTSQKKLVAAWAAWVT
jgi:hypothetical protein